MKTMILALGGESSEFAAVARLMRVSDGVLGLERTRLYLA